MVITNLSALQHKSQLIISLSTPNKTYSSKIVEKLSTVLLYYKVSCYKVAWFTHMLYFIIEKRVLLITPSLL